MYLIYGKWSVGKATAQFCASKGLAYEIHDDADAHLIGDLSRFQWVIVTPWIAPSHPFLQSCGLPIMGELQLVAPYIPEKTKIITVTGTDGKSTCCWMLYNLLRQKEGDNRVFISGNFGTPLSETLGQIDPDAENYIILEVSSFMAERSEWFWSDVTIWTNFETDHLNWHPTHQAYFDAKWKLVQQTRSHVFLNKQLQTARDKYHLVFWHTSAILSWVGDGETIHKTGNILHTKLRTYDFGQSHFGGDHNAQNLLAVLAALEVFFPDTDWAPLIPQVFPLEHRCETVAVYDGRTYIDDSKSTSCQSLAAALQSFSAPIVLIAGGSDKGDSFDSLSPLIKEHVRSIVAIGQTAPAFIKIGEEIGIPCYHEMDMQSAVNRATHVSQLDDVVLLSPWCASFGLFRDYLDRAQKFRAAALYRPAFLNGYEVFFQNTAWSLKLLAKKDGAALSLWHWDSYETILTSTAKTAEEQELLNERYKQALREQKESQKNHTHA